MGRDVLSPAPRSALVTGSSSGIGRSIALRLARDGAAVLCCDLRPEPRESGTPTHELIEQRGGRAVFARCDVQDPQSVATAFGQLDALGAPLWAAVLNAGVSLENGRFLDTSVEDHDRIMGVNERGTFVSAQLAAARLLDQGAGGRIVLVGSISGLVGLGAACAYSTSKGAVVSMARAVALDLAPAGITVNAVCPGMVETALLAAAIDDPSVEQAMVDATPMGRLGHVDDVAAAVAFLASEEAGWITGIALPVDGGYLAR